MGEHCERYLALAMLDRIRIEYFFISGLPSSEALRKWYEDRLGYQNFSAESTGRSYRGNEVRGEVSFRHCEKCIVPAEDEKAETAGTIIEKELFEARRRRLAK